MKLKFINLLLAAFLLIGSAQALTSCKDTDEDLYAQLRDENLKIEQLLKADVDALKSQISALEAVTDGLKSQIAALEASLNDYAKKSDLNDYVKKSEFNGLVDQYIASVSAYNNLTEVLNALKATQDEVTDAHGNFESIGARFTNIEGRLAQLENALETYMPIINQFVENTNISIANLQEAVGTLNAFKENWETKLPTIEQNALDALALAQKNQADIASLTDAYNLLNADLLKYMQDNDAALALIQGKIDELEGNLNKILEDYMTKAQVDQAISDAIQGLVTQDALEALADALRKEAQENLDALEIRLQDQINNCLNRLNGLDTKVADLNSALDALKGELSDLSVKVADNTSKLGILEKALDSVIVRIYNLENRVSGIIIQGVVSPVLGYLNTPFGIQSNFLLNYAGENVQGTDVTFPNFLKEGVEYGSKVFFTDDDINFLAANGLTPEFVTFEDGAALFSDADGNLGTVYLTVNPTNIDLDGKDFTIVNSQDKVMPIELKNLRPSTTELTFGYSRAEAQGISANGFYEADATVAAGDIPTFRVVVDQQLKSAAKKVLKERSASSLLALGNAVYEQFNGFLPALGIRAAWQESDGAETPNTIEHKVYSQYGLGAATFNPLSYSFLYDKSFRHDFQLPDISGLLDKYKFDFTDQGLNITFDPITIDGVNVDFSLSLNTNIGDIDLGTISTTTTVKIEDFPIGFNEDTQELETTTKYIDVPVKINLNDTDLAANLTSAIEDAINGALDGLDGQIKSQFQNTIDQLLGQIQGQVNGMLTSLQTQVNDKLGGILENLQNQVNGKIDMIANQIQNNALYSRLQALVNKFNGVLADPNHYLQPVLLYSKQGQSYGMFSQNKSLPSQFVGNGNAVMLTPTTYTGEIVTPAFKKYVAVTNVYKSSDYSVNAQAGDAKCVDLAKAANAQPYMNEVVSGERRTIPFYFEGAKGYTYEIVYQALDYSGATATSKYYVSIK